MQTDDFEAAFSAFLDRREYDELGQCLSLIHISGILVHNDEAARADHRADLFK